MYVNSQRVSKETIAIFELGSSKRLICYLLNVFSKYTLCRGFTVPSKRIAKDARGNTVGTTEKWHNGDDGSISFHLWSIQYQLLLHYYKRSLRQWCDYCSRMKRNSSITYTEEETKQAARRGKASYSKRSCRRSYLKNTFN